MNLKSFEVNPDTSFNRSIYRHLRNQGHCNEEPCQGASTMTQLRMWYVWQTSTQTSIHHSSRTFGFFLFSAEEHTFCCWDEWLALGCCHWSCAKKIGPVFNVLATSLASALGDLDRFYWRWMPWDAKVLKRSPEPPSRPGWSGSLCSSGFCPNLVILCKYKFCANRLQQWRSIAYVLFAVPASFKSLFLSNSLFSSVAKRLQSLPSTGVSPLHIMTSMTSHSCPVCGLLISFLMYSIYS